ncbi:MAG: sugar transferase [Caulobacterales bacterium]|nr:sugar transferase [Caulobacterales bacterium]
MQSSLQASPVETFPSDAPHGAPADEPDEQIEEPPPPPFDDEEEDFWERADADEPRRGMVLNQDVDTPANDPRAEPAFADIPLWAFPHTGSVFPVQRGVNGFAKRVLDVVVASLLLALAAPLFLAVAIAIKLDSPGPVFFRQRRHGAGQTVFRIWKFRSMTVLDDGGVVRQATPGDQRITRVGAVLRNTSLDELPQLINVVCGEMSLVGPRPHAIAHDKIFASVVPEYDLRFRCRPGITGLAQVNGARGLIASEEDVRLRTRHDLAYQEKWSLIFDLWLIFATPVTLFSHFVTQRSY